jgi:hypothetical protein
VRACLLPDSESRAADGFLMMYAASGNSAERELRPMICTGMAKQGYVRNANLENAMQANGSAPTASNVPSTTARDSSSWNFVQTQATRLNHDAHATC